MQSTLERELNVPETAVIQAYETCTWWRACACVLDARVSSCDYVSRWCVFSLCAGVSALHVSQHGLLQNDKSLFCLLRWSDWEVHYAVTAMIGEISLW